MNYVKLHDDNNSKHARKHMDQVDWAIRELKKQLKKDNFQYELKRREFYMSPSKKKRWRKNEALKRKKRDDRKQEWYEKNHGEDNS